MKIVEMFPSFQGEGVFVGEPVIFLRLGGCNLNCEWCDTKNVKIEEVPINIIINKLLTLFEQTNIKTLVITGGEPTLQIKEVEEIIKHLPKNIKVQIETNGFAKKYLNNVYFVISPKKDIEEVFKFYKDLQNTYFKFVITNKDDLIKIKNLIEKYNYTNTFWLQPEFSRDKEITNLLLQNINLFNNIKLSAQVHKYLNFR